MHEIRAGRFRIKATGGLCLVLLSCTTGATEALGQSVSDDWLTVAANVQEAGYRKTQFFKRRYNTGIVNWDSRVELWLPPSRGSFAWGPYLRVAVIAGTSDDAFQNGWLALPGVGFQMYPLSAASFIESHRKLASLFGPLRFFAEYGRVDYWGSVNSWRPRKQQRVGFEYWKETGVNNARRNWWMELWSGLYWQSSNEFSDQYKTAIFANALRLGVRAPGHGWASHITPYFAIESSRTKYDYGGDRPCVFGVGQCNFYWENRLLLGGGLRIGPTLPEHVNGAGLTRLVVSAEYLRAATYYGPGAPASVPRYDIRLGVSASIGSWYK